MKTEKMHLSRSASAMVLAGLLCGLGPSMARAQLGVGLGVDLGGGATGGGAATLTVTLDPQGPPTLLTGLGDLVVYELMISGAASGTLTVQYANALAQGGAYQWATLTSLSVGSSGQATVNVTIPLGQAWVIRVVENPAPPPAPPPAPSPDPARWAWIQPGTFTMGSPETEYDRSADESPQTQVTLTEGFWIGRFEVTQGEYTAVVGANPSTFTSDGNEPVEQVSWYDATNYCALLTRQEQDGGRLPAGYAYRLPTEAEWEYAARAGSTNRFFFGDDHSYTALADYAWFNADSAGSTHDVGGKQPNQWGLYDTSGNVFEWCADWYGSYPGGSATDPTGPASGTGRVMRGGSWRFPGGDARSAARNFNVPDFASFGIGIRVVLAPTR